MPRPIWRDEIWEPHNGSMDAQYKIEDDRLIMLNDILPGNEGTLHDSGNMNNLANTDTPIGFSDSDFQIEIGTDEIKYVVTDKTTGESLAIQTITGLSTGNLTINDKLLDDGVLVQERRMSLNLNTLKGEVL